MAHKIRKNKGISNRKDYIDKGVTLTLNKTKTKNTDIVIYASTTQIKMQDMCANKASYKATDKDKNDETNDAIIQKNCDK